MRFNGYQLPYGQVIHKPELGNSEPPRLYSIEELKNILEIRNMKIEGTFSDYYGTESSPKYMQLMVFPQKI